MKKTLALLLLIALTITATCTINPTHATTTTPTITVDPNTQEFPNAKVGDIIQVNITANNVQQLSGWDIEGLNFTQTMLNLTNVSEGPFLTNAGNTIFVPVYFSYQTINLGYIQEISDMLVEIASSTGSGVIVTLSFQVLALGTSQITFGQASIVNQNQISNLQPQSTSCNAVNAAITVGPTANVTPTPTASTSSPTPTGSSSTPTSKASSNSPTSTNTADPTATSKPSNIPEYPVLPILIALIAAATISILITAKKKIPT